MKSRNDPCGCGPDGNCSDVDRRAFMKLAGLSVAAVAGSGMAVAGPFSGDDVGKVTSPDHRVPVDKKLTREWLAALRERGESTWYAGDDLATIGMPVGGIGAGQLYILGDGRLAHWDLFNDHLRTGNGQYNYRVGARPKPAAQVAQGYTIQIRQGDKTVARTLDRTGFPDVRFCGEYPIAEVRYAADDVPVSVTLEAFSPFIPLNARDSALPATVMRFTIENTSDAPAEVTLAGWQQNAVCHRSGQKMACKLENRLSTGDNGDATAADGTALLSSRAVSAVSEELARPPIVFEDFEGPDYGKWTVEGTAFGDAPATGALGGQQPVSGFQGKGLVNTYLDKDTSLGKLISVKFTIERPFISFLHAAGHDGIACVNLLVDGKIVRTASGPKSEKLRWKNWDVRDLAGKEAHIEIVDNGTDPWGHVNVDQIEFGNQPRPGTSGSLEEQPDFGSMALALLATDADADADGVETLGVAALPKGDPAKTVLAALTTIDGEPAGAVADAVAGQRFVGALAGKLTLAPGQKKTLTFLHAWYFPNRPDRGNYYAKQFGSAAQVARYVANNYARLAGGTRLWHRTYYDSTLPRWLLDRLHSTVSILATSTCQWWRNGRFWGWEGVGCCSGTCGHVWNYEHAMARLFPELERSVREMQDFNPETGFDAETGRISFRGESRDMWAADAQAGYVLKAYREHQISPDDGFLRRNWTLIRRATEFLIGQDSDDDGLIEGRQHNTYDIDYFGANTMVGSLYLAALRAAQEMAQEMGQSDFAARCRAIFDSGSKLSVDRLFNGEYFTQEVDLEKHPKHQYGDGCLADQLFGQGWAHQVGLGYVYPRETVTAALESIWRYCWAPDVGVQNGVHKPQRWFALPGDAGLFTCTWPKSKHWGPESTLYRNEIWTGIEYQVAGNMAWDGMVTEALAICRGIHDRYHPARHNPFNEVECGDHYSRAMASWSVLTSLCGFEYHGPNEYVGFAPRIDPADFRAAFTAAEGWGTLTQTRRDGRQTNSIALALGHLDVKILAFELPEHTKASTVDVMIAGEPVSCAVIQTGTRLTVTLQKTARVNEGETLEVAIA